MQPGITAKTITRPTLEQVFDAVARLGLRAVQFNFSCAGLPTMPDEVPPAAVERIRSAAVARGIAIVAVSGTFNMIHPDVRQRREGLRRLGVMAAACRQMDVPLVTVCTGTRDPNDMWRRHPDNSTAEAWRDLMATMTEALDLAERHGVALGVEPEVSNVVDSAGKARELLDTMRSPRLKIVMDGANLFHAGQLPRMRAVLQEAFDLLGGELALAHAKDLSHDGEAGQEAAGTGLLDYERYIELLRDCGYQGAVILHSLSEAQAPGCVAFLRAKLEQAGCLASP